MPENYKEFISLTLRTRNSKKPLGMLATNWKHQWLQPCYARHARKTSMGRPVAKPMNSNQNLRVSWKPVNPQDRVWKNLYRNIMRTILQEKVTIHCNITILVHKIYSRASSYENSCSKKQQWIKNGRHWKRFWVGT